MFGHRTQKPGTVSLDQLVALNEEMAALVRAGIPLDKGLVELGRDLPGRMGELADYLGRRAEAGESLPAVMARDTGRFPPVWRAVVEAGLRSGKLSAALEGLAKTGRSVAEMRRMIGLAMVYPLVVLALAYVLFLFAVTRLVPVTAAAYRDLTSSPDPLTDRLVWLGQTAPQWAPWLPLAVAAGWTAWWYFSGRAHGLSAGHAGTWRFAQRPGSWPSIAQVRHDGGMATFAEVLALLIEHELPTHEAVVLAADASGDPALGTASRDFAERLQRGELSVQPERVPAPFPPLMGWLLASGLRGPNLSSSLRATAETYRLRAQRGIAWTSTYLPMLATVVVGGTATVIQALVVFGPFLRLLYALALPT